MWGYFEVSAGRVNLHCQPFAHLEANTTLLTLHILWQLIKLLLNDYLQQAYPSQSMKRQAQRRHYENESLHLIFFQQKQAINRQIVGGSLSWGLIHCLSSSEYLGVGCFWRMVKIWHYLRSISVEYVLPLVNLFLHWGLRGCQRCKKVVFPQSCAFPSWESKHQSICCRLNFLRLL